MWLNKGKDAADAVTGAAAAGLHLPRTRHRKLLYYKTFLQNTGVKKTKGYGRQVDRVRGGTRVDVNKPRSGASTALTISGLAGSRTCRSGRGSGERGRRRRVAGQHKYTHLVWSHDERSKTTSRPTLRSRRAPVQSTSPHPAPDWRVAELGASERRPRCTVQRPARRPPPRPQSTTPPVRLYDRPQNYPFLKCTFNE
ncbi:unnamed protein product [Leptosia nina]|uniref:Uncharacterized protein n=1 Tax=Leptosia nina TaxID=320188 RepID=A0AAV1J7B8_9NEOP